MHSSPTMGSYCLIEVCSISPSSLLLQSPFSLPQVRPHQLSQPWAATLNPTAIHSLYIAKEIELITKPFLRRNSNFSTGPQRPFRIWVLPTPLPLQLHFSNLLATAILSLLSRPLTYCFLCLKNVFSSSPPPFLDNISLSFNSWLQCHLL